ncbi:MAG: hypothetical protein DRI46_14090, partial [Chloroflexi bacterium]
RLHGEGSQQKIDTAMYPHMKNWLEIEYQKHMPRPLFITKGQGGGQKYRLWWLVFDVLNNKNKPVYFYTQMQSTSNYLKKHGHQSLQDWIDDTSPRLQFKP